ncbi:MAG TPA: MBL fold metallo-hydrolase [Candidatus Aerophobetes bacterium]|uniref:MBL fold metallo-hydrolase n=1 Tax=Aerophobetes bacterium TaxID=2030807 RepID=A0A7V5M0M0_UNCAE|nr:MBL fold metallo-hydrolase [Candidatus Aerophobetes bacterium]
MGKIKFLGTAGARIVMIKQLRSSGGIWVNLDEVNILIDPGPGSLLRCVKSRPRLDPSKLDAIILTHKHLDHSGDINVMIEAMTEGGFKKRGILLAPEDALEGEDPVIFRYLRNFPEKIEILKEKKSYRIKDVLIETPIKHKHGVETYGLNIMSQNFFISFITDGLYFEGLEKYYKGEISIINVVRLKPKKGVDHLNLEDAEKIITSNNPKLSILTHFGMTMLRARPWQIAQNLQEKLGLKIIAANDGMEIDLDEYRKQKKN